MEIIFLSLGFTAAIGAHSISKEVVGFSPLWFPRGKYLCLLSLMIDCCSCYSLRYYPKIILSKLIKFLHGIIANLRRRYCAAAEVKASYFLSFSINH